MIDRFVGEYRWLSNFADSPIFLNETQYSTVEHYYQSCKTSDSFKSQEVIEAKTPGKAKRLGAKLVLRENWEQNKVEVMKTGVYLKFLQNPILAEKLLSTGSEELTETNYWCDNYWGQCKCDQCSQNNIKGLNHLGSILMEVRSFLNCVSNRK